MKLFLQFSKFFLLLILFFGPLVYGHWQTDKIRDTYQASQKISSPTMAQSAAPGSSSQAPPAPTIVPDPLNQQNKQMIDWGVLLLGGSVALSITAKLHRIKFYKGLYLLFIGPAAGFLLASLWCGVVFQRRVAFLSIQTQRVADPFEALLSFLKLQSSLLTWSVSLLTLFALCFLFGIVLGWVDPLEKP
jgi:hypothetical protein